MTQEIYPKQEQLRAYVREYGLHVAVAGTGLPACDIRRTYTDPEPVYDHLVRVYQFYRGLAYDQALNEQYGYF